MAVLDKINIWMSHLHLQCIVYISFFWIYKWFCSISKLLINPEQKLCLKSCFGRILTALIIYWIIWCIPTLFVARTVIRTEAKFTNSSLWRGLITAFQRNRTRCCLLCVVLNSCSHWTRDPSLSIAGQAWWWSRLHDLRQNGRGSKLNLLHGLIVFTNIFKVC